MNVGIRVVLITCVLAAGSAPAADRSRAQEELERQLREMVSIPAARLVITLEGLDEPGFKLESAEFMLDGRELLAPPPATLTRPGSHRIFAGEVPEGRHELITRLTYVDDSPVLLSSQAGFKWKIARHVRFEVHDGLELTVRALPERLSGEPDPRKQLVIRYEQDVRMLAQVDTSLPAARAPEPRKADAQDGGAVVATAAAAPPDGQIGGDARPSQKGAPDRATKPPRTRARRGETQPASARLEDEEPTWDRRKVKLAAVPVEELPEAEVLPAAAVAFEEVEDAGTAPPAALSQPSAAEPKQADAVRAMTEVPVPMPMVVGAVVVLIAASAVLIIRWRRRS